ncbi:HEAT repeat domain-containing protein [Hyalangium versicolor]|uniref:HEAT repeat domain-containing protein n=1 Tax=Hyalangium versicolor TaxID=2861190 RepID=UPI001CCE082D|nr:HEAT repeat domain-containing protein [Hyalangium versicolor]
MRHLLLAGFLLTAPAALAQGVAAEPAPSESTAAATSAPVSPDVALLRAILWTSEPAPDEIRAIAIEDLALLGDARALGPLSALLGDPNPRVQTAAVRAVALFQHPRAEEILTSVVRSTRLPDALKIQALDGLLYQRTPSAKAAVEAASRDPRLPYAIQSAAMNVAARWGAAK